MHLEFAYSFRILNTVIETYKSVLHLLISYIKLYKNGIAQTKIKTILVLRVENIFA